MKKKYTSFFLFLMLVLNLLIFFPTTVINAELVNDNSFRIDWDDFAIGLTNGGGSFYTWERTQGDDFRVEADFINTTPKQIYQAWSTGPGDGVDAGNIYITDEGVVANSTNVKIYHNFMGYDGGHASPKSGAKIWNFYRNENIVLRIAWKTGHHGNLCPDVWNGYIIYNYTTSVWEKWFSGGASLYGNIDSYLNITVGVQNWAFETCSILLQQVSDDTILASDEGLQTGDGLPFTFFDKLEITYDYDSNAGSGYLNIWEQLDDIVFFSETILEEEETLGDINFNVYDRETGHIMSCFGHDTIKNVDNYYLYTELHSDLWDGDYNSFGMFGTTISITNLNLSASGEWHYFNMTFVVGFIDPDVIYYYNSTNYLLMFPDQTYTIYVSSVSDYGGYDNCEGGFGIYSDLEFGEPGYRQLCTDADVYTQGESINIRYVAPDPLWLTSNGVPGAAYFIWIYDVENLGFLWWDTDGGRSADNWAYMNPDWGVSLDNNYHFLHWDFDPTEAFGYKAVTGGVDHYKMFIGHGGGGLFGLDIHLTSGPEFYIQTGSFTPHGNITSVSPSEPKLGQFVNISFEANNNGYLTVKNLLAPDDTEQVLTNFQKFEGIEHVNRQFFEFGSYELKLYVSGGLSHEVVDTYTFDITDVNGSYGDFGYGIEFLMVEPERVIAGYDVVFISYRSLDETGEIKILDARGQTTSYGTIVGEKRGVLNITLPNHAAIGEWNVTLLTANNTLYSSFNVIAEENNWVEFYSNVYYENAQFELKLKHDKKVELVFSKDGQEIGTDWYLDVGIFPGGIYPVPLDKVTPSPGSWKVELWQVNNFVKIKKLAEDTCVVVELPPGYITEGGTGDIFQILTSGASSIAEGDFGLAFMAIIFVLVVVVSLAQMKLKNDTIFFAAILMALFMCYIGWLPVWIVVVSIIIAGFLFSSAFSKKLGLGA